MSVTTDQRVRRVIAVDFVVQVIAGAINRLVADQFEIFNSTRQRPESTAWKAAASAVGVPTTAA